MNTQSHQSAWQKFFRDKDGRLLLAQRPNMLILLWAGARLLQWPLSGAAEHWAWLVGTAAIITWAVLEIVDGANSFRRVLGTIVLLLVLL